MGLFNRETDDSNKTVVPVWFMRQAGRYHSHYQALKKEHDFITLCKDPKLAYEVTMGPIDEFNFDAAILFSDLLFPLEHLGMGLKYAPGPILDMKLETLDDVKKLGQVSPASEFYNFQKEACSLLKEGLDSSKTLIGFVGAPFTLYTYAVQGAHAGALQSAKSGLYDGRFEAFCELLLPAVEEEMALQAMGGADVIALFDTAVGELNLVDFKRFIVPKLHGITKRFKQRFPNKKIIYYSKMTSINHLDLIQDDNIDVLGVDYRHDLAKVLNRYGKDYYIQGNIDPCWLHTSWETLEQNLIEFKNHLYDNNVPFDKWIAGLGHGVLIKTPEENVFNTVNFIHENFKY